MQQTIATVEETGEFSETTLSHEGNEVREFWSSGEDSGSRDRKTEA